MDLPTKIYKLLDQLRTPKHTGRRGELVDQQLLIELRKAHRELYITLEANRKQNQFEKEQLDKDTIYSECLQYQKNQLKTNIAQFRSLTTPNYNTIKDTLPNCNDKQAVLSALEQELNARQSKKVQLQAVNDQHEQLLTTYKLKEQQYFTELPDALRAIQSQLVPVLNMFELPLLHLPQQLDYHRELPQPLLSIYQKLCVKFMKIEIIKGPSSDSVYKQSEYELKVSVEEGIHDSNVLQYLQMDEQEFYENIYPLSFNIRYFTTLDKVVFSVDRKNTLTSEELFCGLVKGDPGEPLIENAENDEEININTKYMAFNWANSLAGLSLSANQFYKLLQERINNIQLLKLQIQKFKKTELPDPLPGMHSNHSFTLKYFSATQLIEQPPFWYNLCQGEPLHPSKLRESLLVDDHTIQSYIKLNYHFEGQSEHLNDCYKMILSNKEEQSLEIGIIIPLCYPQQNVKIQLLSNNMNISNIEWFHILGRLGLCKVSGLQLSYQILRLCEEISKVKPKSKYYLR